MTERDELTGALGSQSSRNDCSGKDGAFLALYVTIFPNKMPHGFRQFDHTSGVCKPLCHHLEINDESGTFQRGM